jgi:uncharacterized protein (TIGR03437 family)
VICPGCWVEIYGANLASEAREWGGADFQGTTAPTTLGGVTVSIGGRAAFLRYVSPGQLNVVAPEGMTAAAGATNQVDVTVTNANGTSVALRVGLGTVSPGVLAPDSLVSGGVRYAYALLPDGLLAGPAALGSAFRAAKPGETIVMYGVGFGTTSPAVAPGQIASGTPSLASALKVLIGSAEAEVSYAGLVAGAVGLYQINAVVPAGAAEGTQKLQMSNAGFASLRQDLSIAIGR